VLGMWCGTEQLKTKGQSGGTFAVGDHCSVRLTRSARPPQNGFAQSHTTVNVGTMSHSPRNRVIGRGG
jgi:hypothetical protein